jgi:predicted DNA-binding ribbon-helix-helix protein
MKSAIAKRSVMIDGHKTSVSLEAPFWNGLKEIAHAEQETLSKLVAKIDETRRHGNLSSAIRLYVLDRVRTNGMLRIEGVNNEPAPWRTSQEDAISPNL